MLILKNVFNNLCGSHNACFLTVFPNSCLGSDVVLGPVQILFCPVLTFQSLEASGVQSSVQFLGMAALTPF